ncbi:MAG: hypothetical protein V5B78_12200, partial [Desulfohalobiaceae bacterium]
MPALVRSTPAVKKTRGTADTLREAKACILARAKHIAMPLTNAILKPSCFKPSSAPIAYRPTPRSIPQPSALFFYENVANLLNCFVKVLGAGRRGCALKP